MPERIRSLIISLCNDVEEVIENRDWPTDNTDEVSEKIEELRNFIGAA